MSYQQQRAFANSFDKEFINHAGDFIYANRLLEIQTRLSTAREDQRLGMDAISSFDNITWAFRVRKSSAASYYNNEFTLRYREFDKLLDGHYANYMLYGLEDKANPLQLSKVKLIDMNLAAEQINADEDLKDRILATEISYSANQNSFLCMKYSFFSPSIVIDEAILTRQACLASPYSGLSTPNLSNGIGEQVRPPRIASTVPSWLIPALQ